MLLTQDSGIIETINQDNDVSDSFNDMADELFSCDFQNDAEEAEDADAVSVEEVCSNVATIRYQFIRWVSHTICPQLSAYTPISTLP